MIWQSRISLIAAFGCAFFMFHMIEAGELELLPICVVGVGWNWHFYRKFRA